jgi:ABC-type nickel/cobalt efflux system permease component RcnA
MRRAVLLAVALVALAYAAAAAAHPLGNFTVNQHSTIEPSGDSVYVTYVLDLAEIPTFQARSEVERRGADGYARDLAVRVRDGLLLEAGGRELELRELDHRIAFLPGAGGLTTTRLEIVLEAGPLEAGRAIDLVFEDANYGDRIGWREVVIAARDGATVSGASVPAASTSDGLRSYPDDLLASPLDVRRATAVLDPGPAVGQPPRLTDDGKPTVAGGGREDGFESLIGERELTLGAILVSILVAMFWGAVHALSPGHGKAIVAAYLVGTRGTARQAFYLGGIVTVTHTIGVFALGLVTLGLSEFLVPDQLYPWLNLVAALLVVGVGLAVLRHRLRGWQRRRPRGHHDHAHSSDHDHQHDHDHHHGEGHEHEHGHGHGHHHHSPPALGWRGLLSVGVSGGLLPCPSALVVLLAAISLQRVGYGLVLILAFSVGLAATITGIGLLAIGAKRFFASASFQGPIVRALPAVSALVILGFGIVMTIRALPALT